jgi:putative DNA primase/helicase
LHTVSYHKKLGCVKSHQPFLSIPNLLKDIPQWVLAHVERQPSGKVRKPPYSAHTLKKCDDTDPASWATHDEALSALETLETNITNTGGGSWGIGFVFTADLRLTFLDLDYCRNPTTGAIEPWGWRLIKRLNSYTEMSQSGRGLHIICGGTKPGPNCRYVLPCGVRRIEMYDQNQYCWITGRHVPGTPTTIEYCQTEITDLYHRLWPPSPAPPVLDVNVSQSPPSPVSLDDDTLLELMFRARNGLQIQQLWRGDISPYRSHSEADLALCGHLAFWAQKDAQRMDRLFRQSGLMRDKWNRASYRETTLTTAIRETRRVLGD